VVLRAVEVDAVVAARECAGQQRRQERTDACGARDAGAFTDVEEEGDGGWGGSLLEAS